MSEKSVLKLLIFQRNVSFADTVLYLFERNIRSIKLTINSLKLNNLHNVDLHAISIELTSNTAIVYANGGLLADFYLI